MLTFSTSHKWCPCWSPDATIPNVFLVLDFNDFSVFWLMNSFSLFLVDPSLWRAVSSSMLSAGRDKNAFSAAWLCVFWDEFWGDFEDDSLDNLDLRWIGDHSG
jgi:hypothetical protein